MTHVRKTPEQEIEYDEEGNPYVMWGKSRVLISAFYRELARFVDCNLEYWHGMDCTRDLVIHISRDGDTAIVGRVLA